MTAMKTLTRHRIETQDTILSQLATERLVEVGPAETLLGMAKKTIKADFESHDMATGTKRELLSYKKNADAIYYRTDAEDISAGPETSSKPQPAAIPAATEPAPAAAPVPSQPAAAPGPAVDAASIPDFPISTIDLLVTLTAVALKKSASDIGTDQSIKKLCGGEYRPDSRYESRLTSQVAQRFKMRSSAISPRSSATCPTSQRIWLLKTWPRSCPMLDTD
jgi:fatty acid synthase subunit alpha